MIHVASSHNVHYVKKRRLFTLCSAWVVKEGSGFCGNSQGLFYYLLGVAIFYVTVRMAIG